MDTSKNNDKLLAAALKRCASEQIQYVGAIQNHGVLLAYDEHEIVRMCSNNLKMFFKQSVLESIGHPVANLIGADLVAQIRELITRPGNWHLYPFRLPAVNSAQDGKLGATVHRADQLVVLEISLAPSESTRTPCELLSAIVRHTKQIQQFDDVASYCGFITDEIRRLTNFDRVKIYRFDSQWNGTVIAESRNDALPSLLNHHFPASDIPPQARALYEKKMMRNLVDTEAEPVMIIPKINPSTDKPLDLSLSVLRSVSPVHINYLNIMGVRSTVTLPLIQNEKLWGLMTCHNTQPIYIPVSLRETIEVIASTFSLKIEALESLNQAKAMEAGRIKQQKLAQLIRSRELSSVLAEFQAEYLSLAEASGSFIVIDENEYSIGEIPHRAQLNELIQWLKTQPLADGVFITDSLGKLFAPAQAYADIASGLMLIALDHLFTTYILWFRSETIRNIPWAGSPYNRVIRDEQGPLIDPHRSFNTWLETAHGFSEPWPNTNVDAVKLFSFSIVQQLMTQAQHDALSDPLTGLNNRRQFFKQARRQFHQAQRYQLPMSVMVFDIDHFKRVNDQHGHQIGDIVLQAVAKDSQSAIRDSDLLGRIGGEEFAIVLPNTDLEAAKTFANRLCHAVPQHPIKGEWGTITPTISIGVVMRQELDSDFETLLNRADKAMYCAKKMGRNQVHAPLIFPKT